MLRFLSSLKLTLTLLLGLALVAVAGTLTPGVPGRYDLYYQSVGFRLLLALLALNLCACTLQVIRRKWSEPQRWQTLLEQSSGTPLTSTADDKTLRQQLQRAGYHVSGDATTLIAQRHRGGRWGSTLVHLAILLIMGGALSAELGFVGTANMYVGDTVENYFDWESEGEKPLGFGFRLDAFEPIYYPIELKFGLVDLEKKEVLNEFVAREGETVALPTPGMEAMVKRFYPNEGHLVLGIRQNGRELGDYHTFTGRRDAGNDVDPGGVIKLLGYRDPLLRQLRCEVSVLEGEKVVQSGVIQVNHPLNVDGTMIYQTVYAYDEFGFWSVGFQISRDPGENVVWGGSILLIFGLALAFLFPLKGVGLRRDDNGWTLVTFAGFRGDAGEEAKQKLLAELNTSANEPATPL